MIWRSSARSPASSKSSRMAQARIDSPRSRFPPGSVHAFLFGSQPTRTVRSAVQSTTPAAAASGKRFSATSTAAAELPTSTRYVSAPAADVDTVPLMPVVGANAGPVDTPGRGARITSTKTGASISWRGGRCAMTSLSEGCMSPPKSRGFTTPQSRQRPSQRMGWCSQDPQRFCVWWPLR